MTTATYEHSTSGTYFSVAAARYKILAIEAEIQALVVLRAADPEKIQKTEDTYRGLIARQARYRQHARQLAKQMSAEVTL